MKIKPKGKIRVGEIGQFTSKFRRNSPAKTEVTAAIRKERVTAGPAVSRPTWPMTTYSPAPKVLPMPGKIKR